MGAEVCMCCNYKERCMELSHYCVCVCVCVFSDGRAAKEASFLLRIKFIKSLQLERRSELCLVCGKRGRKLGMCHSEE